MNQNHLFLNFIGVICELKCLMNYLTDEGFTYKKKWMQPKLKYADRSVFGKIMHFHNFGQFLNQIKFVKQLEKKMIQFK